MKILTRTVMIVAGIVAVLFFCFWKADDAMRDGELFERHVVPGKPDLEIRIFGFVDAGFSAWLDTGWRKKQIFDSLECYAPDFLESTNPIVRSFQGTIVQRERDRNLMPPMFAVLWSADAQRVGIAFKGYFVAAYDRATGEKLQFADYHQDMHVKGRDGSELWHDYQQCDADIERFLREEPGPDEVASFAPPSFDPRRTCSRNAGPYHVQVLLPSLAHLCLYRAVSIQPRPSTKPSYETNSHPRRTGGVHAGICRHRPGPERHHRHLEVAV